MLDLDALLTAVKATIVADPACGALGGRVFLDVAIGAPKPHLILTVIPVRTQGAYAAGQQDTLVVRLIAVSTDLAQANALAKAMAAAFDRKVLSGGQTVGCRYVGSGSNGHSAAAAGVTYRAWADIECKTKTAT